MAASYQNFRGGLVDDSPLTNVATTLTSTALEDLAAVVAPDFKRLVLDPDGDDGEPEVVHVTAHTALATTATISRGQDGSSARQHVATTPWVHAATKGDFDDLPHVLLSAKGGLISASAANTPSVLAAGTNGLVLTTASGETTGLQWANAVPAGSIIAGCWSAAPTGYLLFGQTVVGAEGTYAALWAVAPASWKTGADLVLPDLSDRTLMDGGTLGATGGANTVTLAEANLPAHDHTIAHTHTIDHNHAAVTSAVPSDSTTGTHSATHTHTFSDTSSSDGAHQHTGEFLSIQNGAGGLFDALMTNAANPGTTLTSNNSDGAHTHTVSGTTGNASVGHTHEHSHTHSVDLPNFTGTSGASSATDSGSVGSGTAVTTTPAHLRINYAIKT